MKWTNLTVIVLLAVLFTACDKEEDIEPSFTKTGLPVTSTQAVPSLPTPGSGTLDISYTPSAKTMTYTVSWSNLTDSVIAIRINGPSVEGYVSPNLAFTGANPTSPLTTPHNVLQEIVGSATRALFGKTGSYSNTLYVDGVKIKESELLNNMYYITIHTKTIIPAPVTAPASLAYRWFGELRGQIIVR